ncbi:MAG TPA: phosphonopyruvate decarboxylase [Xanthobacteraceae bacterium]|jgi:sulfopyruvate decarboxylase alpha subunit
MADVSSAAGNPDDWRDQVFDAFERAGIEIFCYLPDAGLDSFIRRANAGNAQRAVILSTEEEGVGICCGAWLGGKRAVLMIQSSGVGNCINTFSLVSNCRFPFFLLVSMRGEFGEGNPWQIPMGSTTQDMLELAGFQVFRATHPEDAVTMVTEGLKMAWRSDAPVAVLLSQRLIGAKDM